MRLLLLLTPRLLASRRRSLAVVRLVLSLLHMLLALARRLFPSRCWWLSVARRLLSLLHWLLCLFHRLLSPRHGLLSLRCGPVPLRILPLRRGLLEALRSRRLVPLVARRLLLATLVRVSLGRLRFGMVWRSLPSVIRRRTRLGLDWSGVRRLARAVGARPDRPVAGALLGGPDGSAFTVALGEFERSTVGGTSRVVAVRRVGTTSR